ncbi:MAG: hypothetical protein AAGF23_09980 [Acidobacteriota bacterium]
MDPTPPASEKSSITLECIEEATDDLELNAPASADDLERLAAVVPRESAPDLFALLGLSDGLHAHGELNLYDADSIPERNDTYGIVETAPGWLMIGDNGGGRFFVLEPAAGGSRRVHAMDTGALFADDAELVAESLAAWACAGFPIDEDEESDLPDSFDVYLESAPAQGIKMLLKIKKHLQLDTSIAELKSAFDHLPARILADASFGRAVIGAAFFELETGDRCLKLYKAGDRGHEVTIPKGTMDWARERAAR